MIDTLPRSLPPGPAPLPWLRLLLALVLFCGAPGVASAEQYRLLSERDFLAGAFPGSRPAGGRLDIDAELAASLSGIFGHRFRGQRLRYWQAGPRSAWIIEEIGKEKPITIGVVVEEARLVSIAVLVYREGHGMEVAEPGFTTQFPGAGLRGEGPADYRLDRDIDNITGATLSVRAMTRCARAALLLDARLRGTQAATGAQNRE